MEIHLGLSAPPAPKARKIPRLSRVLTSIAAPHCDRIPSEWVAGLRRNQWPHSIGMPGRFASECAKISRFSATAACGCRSETPQNRRLKIPQLAVFAGLPGRAPEARRARFADALPIGGRGGGGGQAGGSGDDPRFTPPGTDGVGDRPAERARSQDGAPIHRARVGTSDLWSAAAEAGAAGPVHRLSARAGEGLSGPDRITAAA